MNLTRDDIEVAYNLILPHIKITPILVFPRFSALASNAPFARQNKGCIAITTDIELVFKCENFQETGSFKFRGVTHIISRMKDEDLKSGVAAASSGNHGKALAKATQEMAARKGFPIPTYVVMTTAAMQSKIVAVQANGAKVIRSDISSAARSAMTKKVCDNTGAILIPTANHEHIILGQGTAGLEFVEQVKQVYPEGLDIVMVPCGGGGLLAGVAIALEGSGIKVFGAEPIEGGADDAARGIREGRRIEQVSSVTIADGLRSPLGTLTWEIISNKRYVEGIYSVTEEQIKQTLRLFIGETKMIIEPSAAVPLAVVLFSDEFREYVAAAKKKRIGVLLSGGNIDAQTLLQILL